MIITITIMISVVFILLRALGPCRFQSAALLLLNPLEDMCYTRSPLEDSRLFGPSPWKILAATNEKDISEQPSPWRKSSERESCNGDRV